VAPAANKGKIIENGYLERASLMSDKHTIMPAEGGHIREELSAYIDGALGAAEHEAVRSHIEGCTLCRVEYEELSATRNLMRSVPLIAPPRAFTLTEEMVAPVRPAGFWEKLLSPRNGSRLATGSALSFALVLMLLVGNVLFIRREAAFSLSGPSSASSAATHTSGTGDLQLGEAPLERYAKGLPETRTENAQPPQAQEGLDTSESTPAADAMTGASPEAMATNAPVAMPAPTVTTMATGGIGRALPTPYVSGIIEATPSLPDRDGAVAQVTATPVSVSASVLATATALRIVANFQAIEATAEAVGRAAPQPARPREVYPLFDEPSGDGRSIYVGLVALFVALGVLLGAGALVARSRGSR
jgi:hypothetical protein